MTAVILAGLLSLTGSAVGAEELTGNIVLEKAPEARIDDTDFSEEQIFLSNSESKESALLEDDVDEAMGRRRPLFSRNKRKPFPGHLKKYSGCFDR